jgi:hypothetical protein
VNTVLQADEVQLLVAHPEGELKEEELLQRVAEPDTVLLWLPLALKVPLTL